MIILKCKIVVNKSCLSQTEYDRPGFVFSMASRQPELTILGPSRSVCHTSLFLRCQQGSCAQDSFYVKCGQYHLEASGSMIHTSPNPEEKETGAPPHANCVRHFLGRRQQTSIYPRQRAKDRPNNGLCPSWWPSEHIGVTYRSVDGWLKGSCAIEKCSWVWVTAQESCSLCTLQTCRLFNRSESLLCQKLCCFVVVVLVSLGSGLVKLVSFSFLGLGSFTS